jgi:hypothetical protein
MGVDGAEKTFLASVTDGELKSRDVIFGNSKGVPGSNIIVLVGGPIVSQLDGNEQKAIIDRGILVFGENKIWCDRKFVTPTG